MTKKHIIAIAKKDLHEIMKSRQIMIPLVILPLLVTCVIPILMIYLPVVVNLPGNILMLAEMMKEKLPLELKEQLSVYTEDQRIIIVFLQYFFAPFFIIIPLFATNFIAADSIAGEREKNTLELLTYAPLHEREILLAKILAILTIGMGVTCISFVVYCLVANFISIREIGHVILPNILWSVLILYLVPLMAFFGIGVMVIVSAKAKGFREAQQLGGFIVLPAVLLTLVQAVGVIYFNIRFVILLGLIMLVVDFIVMKVGEKVFKESLVG
jgi:ABC-type Na+ efflux pump permease subunit